MAETQDNLRGTPDAPQNVDISQAQIASLVHEPAADEAPRAQSETGVPAVQQPEPPPEWAATLQTGMTALQEQMARWQTRPPAWFRQAMAKLPREAARQIDLAAELRQLDQRAQKARDTQTRALVASFTRAVTVAVKGFAVQFGTHLKDLDRRTKSIEKVLGRIQRKQR